MSYISRFLLFIVFVNVSCSNLRVEDFYVPELPISEEYFIIDQNEGLGKKLSFNFTLFKSNFKLFLDLDKEIYKEVTHFSRENPWNSEQGMRQDQYDVYIYDSSDYDVLNRIIDALIEREGKKEYDLAQLLVAFVQSIPYDFNAKEPKYVIETLYNNTGDCDDKSILLSKLLSYAGYETCLFVYEKGQHMAVGLKVDSETKSYRDGYIYIESTGYHPIGQIPQRFADGIDIRKEVPKILEVDVLDSFYPISSYNELKEFYSIVNNKYGEAYFNTSIEGRLILEKIEDLKININEIKKTLNDLKKEIDTKKGIVEVEEVNNKINEYNGVLKEAEDITNTYNKLIRKLNSINQRNYIK